MSRYRKIDPRIWSDEKFRALSEPAQFFFFYALTGGHTTNLPGLSNIGVAALAERLGGKWTSANVQKCLGELTAQGMAYHDQMAQVLWVPNVIRYDPPNSINTVKSWGTPWGEIRACDLKRQAYHVLKAYVEGLGEGLRLAFENACPPLPNADTPLSLPGKSLPPKSTRKLQGRKLTDLTEDEQAVLAHLNQVAKAQFRSVSHELRSRLAEGVTVAECCLVLDWLLSTWSPEYVSKYLDTTTPFRPEKWDDRLAKANAWAAADRAAPGLTADELFRV